MTGTPRGWSALVQAPKVSAGHLIHLSEFAVAPLQVLRRLRAWRQGSSLEPWLRPGTGDGPVHVKALGRPLSDRQRGRLILLPGCPGPAGRRESVLSCAKRLMQSHAMPCRSEAVWTSR